MSPDAGSTQPARKLQPGQAAAIWGVVAAAWAVFLLPLFFGAVGVALGGYAWWRGERRGRWVILAAVVCTLFGLGSASCPTGSSRTEITQTGRVRTCSRATRRKCGNVTRERWPSAGVR